MSIMDGNSKYIGFVSTFITLLFIISVFQCVTEKGKKKSDVEGIIITDKITKEDMLFMPIDLVFFANISVIKHSFQASGGIIHTVLVLDKGDTSRLSFLPNAKELTKLLKISSRKVEDTDLAEFTRDLGRLYPYFGIQRYSWHKKNKNYCLKIVYQIKDWPANEIKGTPHTLILYFSERNVVDTVFSQDKMK